jgi:hypothetical protein
MGNVLKMIAVIGVFVLLLAACSGDSDGDDIDAGSSNGGGTTSSTEGEPSDGASGGGDVVNRQEPGQAAASVDGEDFAFDAVGPVGCTISDSEVTVGFIFGDNEVSFVAGATASGSDWRGRIDLNVQGPDGVTNYFADFSGGGGAVAVDGSSMSYSGDWEVLRPGESEAEPAGKGTISATCG